MTVKRRLTRIRLDKIAAVDKPCQEHATVAIIKRAPENDTTPRGLAKATFGEALEGNLIAGAVNEAFFQSFDGLWERNDAFREALTDELAAGGDGSTASAAYVESVKALVDAAVAEARSAGATAADTKTVDKALSAAADRWLKSRKEQTMKITTKAELAAEIAKFDPAKSPAAHVGIIQKAATDLKAEDLLPADGPLAKAKPDPELAKMGRELAILKLSPEAKSYFDGLDEGGQTAFLAKSAADQAKDVAAANASDPVVYKTKSGIEIRKSAGDTALALAKQADADREELVKLRGEVSGTTLEKRAAEEYPKVAKNVAVDMLRSVETLGKDTEAGKAVLKSLEQMNKGGERLFKSLGSTEGSGTTAPEGIAKARTDFDSKVAEIASRDKIGKADAMSKARTEHPDLFKAAFPETAEAAEGDREPESVD